MITARQALQKLCKGKADQKVEIYRRPLRKLLEIAEAVERYRRAQNDLAALHFAGTFGGPFEEQLRCVVGAQAELDELLRCLDVPA